MSQNVACISYSSSCSDRTPNTTKKEGGVSNVSRFSEISVCHDGKCMGCDIGSLKQEEEMLGLDPSGVTTNDRYAPQASKNITHLGLNSNTSLWVRISIETITYSFRANFLYTVLISLPD